MRGFKPVLAAALAVMLAAPLAQAGDCTGFVVGVRPLNQYNHDSGNGFLAIRSGPGSNFNQLGEIYAGDEFAVWERSGKWVYIKCMSGQCTNPLWGPPYPAGWSYAGYLDYGGVCP